MKFCVTPFGFKSEERCGLKPSIYNLLRDGARVIYYKALASFPLYAFLQHSFVACFTALEAEAKFIEACRFWRSWKQELEKKNTAEPTKVFFIGCECESIHVQFNTCDALLPPRVVERLCNLMA